MSCFSLFEYAPVRDGWAVFNCTNDSKPGSKPFARLVHNRGQLYLVPLRPLTRDEIRSVGEFMRGLERGEVQDPRAA